MVFSEYILIDCVELCENYRGLVDVLRLRDVFGTRYEKGGGVFCGRDNLDRLEIIMREGVFEVAKERSSMDFTKSEGKTGHPVVLDVDHPNDVGWDRYGGVGGNKVIVI